MYVCVSVCGPIIIIIYGHIFIFNLRMVQKLFIQISAELPNNQLNLSKAICSVQDTNKFLALRF